MSNNYTILHCHSDLSNGITNIDSVTKYGEYIKRAKELGMSAIAFSEHGSVMSWVHKKQDIEAEGLKYIHAEEFYVTETLSEKVRDNWHCLLIAKNYDGVLELNKLSTKSFNRDDNSFYYVPRITLDDVLNTSDNVIVSSACLGGILNKANQDVQDKFLSFLVSHKYRCFLELQPHLDVQQVAYNQKLYELHNTTGIPMVMCTDTHALNAEHIEGRKILQKAKNIHFDGEDNFHLEMMSYDELVSLCEQQSAIPMDVYLDAIENTNKIAEIVETFDLDYTYKYPHLWGDDSKKVFIQKIKAGIKRRGVDKFQNRKEYADRVWYEMKAYEHNGAIDFMLLMEDIISWCHTVGIEVGYGRGSVNGSIIAWLLGITEMDSIKHNLNFDRFMNIERVSLSDVDTDFPPSRIDEVKQYIFNKHGLYCSDIVTFNTIALKGAIRDVGRALEMQLDVVGKICDSVETDEENLRKKYPKLFEYVDIVNGTIVSIGNHPCGAIVSPYSINDRLGLLTTSTDTVQISQINMKEIDGLNYVKLDLLKLDTIEIINETCKLANIERLTPDNVDIADVKVWNSIRDNTTGIFQWEGTTGDRYIKHLLSDENIKAFQEINPNVDYMTLLSIGNSAIRPAGASYRDDLGSGVVRKSGSVAIDDFLKPTFGYLVFQEQIIQFLHGYCGYTMGEADVVRRHFAKKYGTGDDIPKIKAGFIKTMQEKYNMPQQEAEETIVAFIQVIEDASRYLFSLNHSQPYSYEGYVCGYLRYYYPLQFLTVCLNINKDNEEKTKAVTQYANSIGVLIKPPKFRHSKADYAFDENNNTIFKGMSSIKFMNVDVAEQLYAMREQHFNSFVGLLNVFPGNSRQLEILISLGFFEEFGKTKKLLSIAELYDKFHGKKQLKKDKAGGIPVELLEKYTTQTAAMYKFTDTDSFLKELCAMIPDEDMPTQTRIKRELEYLGYCGLTIPEQRNVGYVIDVNAKYSPKITIYQLWNGKTETYKLQKKLYQNNPFDAGYMIKFNSEMRNKSRKDENGQWVKLPETEPWIQNYILNVPI